jgi:hypothetical protein
LHALLQGVGQHTQLQQQGELSRPVACAATFCVPVLQFVVDFGRLIPMLFQVKVGTKKFFCDAIIKKVPFLKDGLEIIEDEFVNNVCAPLCREILKVCRLSTRLNMQKSSPTLFFMLNHIKARELLVKNVTPTV